MSLPVSLLTFGVILSSVVFSAEGDVCFKKFNPLKPGCHKELRNQELSVAEECCSAGGQGYASKLEHVGKKRKWYQCTPCPRFVTQKTLKSTENEIDREETVNVIHMNRDSEEFKKTLANIKRHLKNKTNKTEKAEITEDVKKPVWTDWSAWGPCKGTCGESTQQRGRFCLQGICEGNDLEERQCAHLNPCPVDGGWGDWHDWEQCSVTCGSGTQIRIRKCDRPVPAYGGRGCEGVSEQSQHCVRDPCPVHGGWSEWGDWTPCNVTCGVGHQEHMRKCNNPTPQYGGSQCQGEWVDVRTCAANTQCSVDGGWCEWGDWTSCLVSGFQTAFRACECPKPQFGGDACKGRYVKKRDCIASDSEDSSADENSSEESSGDSEEKGNRGCQEGSGDGSDVNCDQEPDDLNEASYNSVEEDDSFEASGAYIQTT